jgi:hypothetical protein
VITVDTPAHDDAYDYGWEKDLNSQSELSSC